MIARIFLVILVFSLRRLLMSEVENPFQMGFSLLKALDMSEYSTVMIAKGMAIKKTDRIMKWILSALKLPNAGSKLMEQMLIPFTLFKRAM